jgi:hypothetical protein
MARVTITQDNFDRSRIVPPGKYPIEVTDSKLEQAGTDGSDLWVYELRIIDGAFKGVVMRFQVSEKAQGMGYSFWEACGQKVVVGAQIDPLAVKGKRCIAFVQRGEYKGRPQNQPVDFARLEGPGAEATQTVKAE